MNPASPFTSHALALQVPAISSECSLEVPYEAYTDSPDGVVADNVNKANVQIEVSCARDQVEPKSSQWCHSLVNCISSLAPRRRFNGEDNVDGLPILSEYLPRRKNRFWCSRISHCLLVRGLLCFFVML